MTTRHYFTTLLALILLAGCKTTEKEAGTETLISPDKQQSLLSKTTPPQRYGFKVFAAPEGGIGFHGEGHLHPRHTAAADFIKGDVPVIALTGRSSRCRMNALLDASSPTSWMEFSTALEFGVKFLGWNKQPIPYRGIYNTGGINAFAGVVSQLRVNQLFIEDLPLYVRMASGSLGPLARGIKVPSVDAVIGWDCLKLFEYIQFDLQKGWVYLSAATPYQPKNEMAAAEALIINLPGHGLAVNGAIFGENLPIQLDFAGDYHFARGDKRVTVTKQISIGEIVCRQVPTLILPSHKSPPRVGRKILEPYVVTICPKKGVVYFERRAGEE